MAAITISIIDAKYIDMAAAYDADLDTTLCVDVYVESRDLNPLEIGMLIHLLICQVMFQ